MARREFALDLAKLVIAAAWADGEVQNEELNELKHLVLSIPDFSNDDWRQLRVYLDHPVSDDERRQLLENMLGHVSSKGDKSIVLSTLRKLVEADGVVTDEEAELMTQVEEALDQRSTGVVGVFGSLLSTLAGGRRRRIVREHRVDELLENPVYFRLSPRRDDFAAGPEVLRPAALAAGLMAAVACIDKYVADEEVAVVRTALATQWALSEADAQLLTEVAVKRAEEEIDVFRLGKNLKDLADNTHRRALMGTLWRIGHAHTGLTSEEDQRLRVIGKCLGLSSRDVLAERANAMAD